ncbi:MAG: 4'-phosphopantetheinyl transferase superfamily protein, partial [Flammeovirgaceae bacterium]|nr:4'-phosphopantetheinyl transferase superfamily protein [Flammeovirgaceae bacterium]
ISPHQYWGACKIEEDDDFLIDFLEKKNLSDDFFAIQHPQKRKQWLASRCLLKQLTQHIGIPYEGIRKDNFGKPFLLNASVEISFSHTNNMAAVIVDFQQSTGIDVEQIDEKLYKIAPRFLTNAELHQTQSSLEEIAYFWCAKEAMYKLYGKKQLTFRENLIVEKSFVGEGFFQGTIVKDNFRKMIRLKGEKIDNYLVVFAL